MKEYVLVALTHCNPRWVRIYSEIIADYQSRGASLCLLDFSDSIFPVRRTRFFSKWLRQYATSQNVTVWSPGELLQRIEFLEADLPGYSKSEFFSYFRDDNPTGLLAKRFLKAQMKTAQRVRQEFSNLLRQLNCRELYIPNGRGFIHNLISEIADSSDSNVEILYLETAAPHNPLGDRYFSAPYPIHNRVARQAQIGLKVLDENLIRKLSDLWLEPRMQPKSRLNAFSAHWSSQTFEMNYQNVFFTSSTDEYWSLGDEWHIDEWEDQYEAFDYVLHKLEQMGESSFALRIHPNLLNKSFRFAKREFSRIEWITKRHKDLFVILPHEPINSYALMEKASRVFVSMSTIGLEASAAGKSVWCTSATSYDRTADIRQLLGREQVNDADLNPWSVNMTMARKWVAYFLLEGRLHEHFISRIYPSKLSTFPLRSLGFRTLSVVRSRLDRRRNFRLSKVYGRKNRFD
jgi:hypothetical protein